jgi:hypothetical protein
VPHEWETRFVHNRLESRFVKHKLYTEFVLHKTERCGPHLQVGDIAEGN